MLWNHEFSYLYTDSCFCIFYKLMVLQHFRDNSARHIFMVPKSSKIEYPSKTSSVKYNAITFKVTYTNISRGRCDDTIKMHLCRCTTPFPDRLNHGAMFSYNTEGLWWWHQQSHGAKCSATSSTGFAFTTYFNQSVDLFKHSYNCIHCRRKCCFWFFLRRN